MKKLKKLKKVFKEMLYRIKRLPRTAKKVWRRLKDMPPKKIIIVAVLSAIVIVGGWFLATRVLKPKPKQLYDVAVMVRSQHNPNKTEDLRSSLKYGDVLMVQAADHKWSTTEKVSYLILKMKLTEEQVAKLTGPEEREIKLKELSDEERSRIEEEGREDEPRMETLRARAYQIDMSEFEGFEPLDLLKGQPYKDKVFGWRIVEKKESLK